MKLYLKEMCCKIVNWISWRKVDFLKGGEFPDMLRDYHFSRTVLYGIGYVVSSVRVLTTY
jgi:hypothetical protein